MTERPLDATTGLDLLEKAHGGDRAALNELLERLRPWMRNIASHVKQRRGEFDSSDVVQDAQILIMRHIQNFRGTGVGQFCAWVRTIVGNEARRLDAKRSSPEPLPDGSSAEERIPAQEDTPSEHAIENERREQVQQAITKLSVEDQDVILLRDYENLEYEGIADVLAITSAVARQRHVRALKRLQKELEESILDSGGQP